MRRRFEHKSALLGGIIVLALLALVGSHLFRIDSSKLFLSDSGSEPKAEINQGKITLCDCATASLKVVNTVLYVGACGYESLAAALADAPAGATIVITPGTYTASTTTTVALDNITINAAGATLKRGRFEGDLLHIKGDGVTINGLTLDGSHNISRQDGYLNNGGRTGSMWPYFRNAEIGIHANRVTINNATIDHSRWIGIQVNGNDCTISGCRIAGDGYSRQDYVGYGIAACNAATGTKIVGCYIEKTGINGIYIGNVYDGRCHHTLIADTTTSGCHAQVLPTGGGQICLIGCYDTIITGCTVVNSAGATAGGIEDDGIHTIIQNTHVERNWYGIYRGAYSVIDGDSSTIIGCVIAENRNQGIIIESTSTHTNIIGNNIHANARNGLRIAAGVNNIVVSGNSFYNNAEGPILKQSTADDIQIFGNTGVNQSNYAKLVPQADPTSPATEE